VSDLIDAHMLALEHLRGGGGNLTLNVGYGHGYSVREIIETARRVGQCDFPVCEGPRRLGDPVEVVADARLIRKAFGWKPKFDDIETIVAHAYAWELKMREKRASSAAIVETVPRRQSAL
jgi:UDP-glucose 4-epimerase